MAMFAWDSAKQAAVYRPCFQSIAAMELQQSFGLVLVPRSPVQVRQIPANANRLASGRANQRFTDGVPCILMPVFLSGSANLVTGTRQRPPMSLPTVTAGALSHGFQKLDPVLRTFVTWPDPGTLGGLGKPQRISLMATRPSASSTATGASPFGYARRLQPLRAAVEGPTEALSRKHTSATVHHALCRHRVSRISKIQAIPTTAPATNTLKAVR